MKRNAMNLGRRGMAGFLALVMLFAAFPITVFAAGQSIDDILAELRDYDALYDQTGLVASYDFSGATEKDKVASGDTVALAEGLSLQVVNASKKVEDGVKYVRAYGDGYLSLSANNRLVISGLSGDAYTVTANFAYAQSNAMPVDYTAVTGDYSVDWIGSRWRDIFTMGGLSVSGAYMTAKERDAVAALAAEYQAIAIEYEKINTEELNGKDTQITFLTDCTFKMPNGLTFGDVYYLLHEDLQMPNGQLGTSAAFNAEYYEYLEYDANFYSQWKENGIVAASFVLNGGVGMRTDFAPSAKAALSAPYGQSLSLSIAYANKAGAGAAPYKSVLGAVWSNGQNVGLSGEEVSATAPNADITVLSDVAADVFAIRVYEGRASDTQIAQNHFADIAKYHQLNIFSFLRLPTEGKAEVYKAFAGVSMTALNQKQAQALLDDTIDNLSSLSFDYESLYVKDADGDGVSDLVLDWNAFGKSAEDNAANGLIASTTLVDKNGVTFTVPSTASWVDNALLLNKGSISFKDIMPSIALDGFNATTDTTIEFMISHEGDSNTSGNWQIGPFSAQVNQKEPLDESYGPISGTYWGGGNWGTDCKWTNVQPRWMGKAYGVPFHAGLYIDTEINTANLAASTYSMGYYHNGAAASNGSSTYFGSNAVTYTPTKTEDRFTMFPNLISAIYTIRIYDCVLTTDQATQNVFADFASMFTINLTQYSLLPEDGQRAVRAAVATLNVAEYASKADAQKAFDEIINALPASQRYDYSYLYDHDIDNDGKDDLLFDWDAFGKSGLDNNDKGKVTSTTMTDNFGNTFTASKDAEWGDGYLYNAGGAIDLSAFYPYTTVTNENGTIDYYYEDMYFDFLVAHAPRIGNANRVYVGPMSFQAQTRYEPENTSKDYYPADESYGPMSGTYCEANGWGTDSWWASQHFMGNYYYKTFRFGIFVNTTNDIEAGTGTYNFGYYRDGAPVQAREQSKELDYAPASAAPKLTFGGNLAFRYYSLRIYTMPLPTEVSEKNHFADKMRFYGLDPVSYISGSEEQRALVHELLDNEQLGDTMIETIRGKYEAIYSEETDLTVEDLYAQDKLLFSFDAFDLDENSDLTTLVDKFGTPLKMQTGANWKIENGALVLGDTQNGAITLENILANGSYTVQIVMAYRSGAENGYNKADGDISRDTFRFGGVTLGNVMNKDASYIVQSSPIKMGGVTVGAADGFVDLDTYSGSLLAGRANEVFELTAVVNASSTKAAPTFYRDGELVLTLDASNFTASKDVVIGEYADLEIYAIRVYATKLGADAMTKNHFADLMKYHGADMKLFNQLTQARRDRLYSDYADVALDETSCREMTQSMVEALADQLAPEAKIDQLFGFDGYSVRLHSGTGLRAGFTLDKASLESVVNMVSEIGILHAVGQLPYLSEDGVTKTIVYGAGGYSSALLSNGKVFEEIMLSDLSTEELTKEHYFRSYMILKLDGGSEITIYGDMTSEVFGESVNMTELMARFNENGTREGGGLTPVALFANSNEFVTYVQNLYNAIEALKKEAIGDSSYVRTLLLAAQTAMKEALAIKEGTASSSALTNVTASAAAAKKAAFDALRQAEFDAEMILSDANDLLAQLQEAVSVLEAAVDYGYATRENLKAAEELLLKAETIVLYTITDEMTLISSSARNAAVLAEKAKDAVSKNEYGANNYLRVLYLGDGDIESLYDQLKVLAEGYGFDDIILGSLVFDGAVDENADASYRKLIGGKWFDIQSKSFDSAVLDEDWNAVILSPDSALHAKLSSAAFVSRYTALANAVRALNSDAKLYYSQGWAPSERQAVIALGDQAKRDGLDANRIYNNLIAYANALPSGIFDGVLPTATLLENLRTSVYLEAIFEWANGYELSDLGAYATAAMLLSELTDFDSDDLTYRLSSMKDEEIDWVLESMMAAIRTPNAITESSIQVYSGVHEEDDDVLTIYAIGASNISNGPIFTWLQTYMATRNPNKKYVLLNEGIPGEGISGGAGRLNYIIDGDPDIVLVHYGVYNAMCNYFDRTKSQGLNCTVEKKLELMNAHKENVRKMLDAYLANGTDVILSCEGYVIKPDHNWQTDGYTMNWAYAEVTNIHKEFQAMTNPDGSTKYPNIIGVLDTTTHFKTIIQENGIPEDQSGDEVIFNSDGLHISYPGGAVYTALVINTLKDVVTSQSGFENFISDIVSDVTIRQDGTANVQNAMVSGVTVSQNSVSYKYLANALPLPADANYLKAAALQGVDMAAVNQENIRVEGLSAGNYAVKIDGVKIGTYTAEQLAAGVNIAEIANNPAQVQAKTVYGYVSAMASANSTLNRLDYCLFTFYGLGYIDRDGNFLYSEAKGRYYNEDDLRAYAASKGDKNGGWYASAMYACYTEDDPLNSLMATRAQNQAIVNKNTYLMHEAAKPIERTVQIVKE